MLETIKLSLRVSHRNWAVYKKSFWSNIAPTLSDPALFIFSIGMGLGAYVHQVEGLRYVEYLAPGLCMSSVLFTAFFEASYNFYIRMNFEGIFTAMLTTPIGPREIIIGEYFWLAMKGAFMSFIMALVMSLFGLTSLKWVWIVPIYGALVAMACGGLGLISSCWVRNIDQFQTVYAFLISPMFFFSGIFFPVSDLPSGISWLPNLSPLYHGVKLTQMVLWDRVHGGDLFIHLWALLFMGVSFFFIAYKILYRKLYSSQ